LFICRSSKRPEAFADIWIRRGSRVKVVLEIEAEDPNGFDEATRRNVTENANTLGFGHHEFEQSERRLCRRAHRSIAGGRARVDADHRMRPGTPATT
jgi:hypothetical protein